MTCEVDKREGVLRICGEMTIYNAAALKADFFSALNEETDICTVDLAAVSEFDTTGLQLLLMARKVCLSRGGSFSVVNPSPAVRETLNLLRGHNLPVEEVGA